MKSRQGFSIMEVLVVAGMMMFLMLGVGSFLKNQNAQVKLLEEKLLIKEIEAQLKAQLLNPDYCNCLLRGKTFDTTTSPATIVSTNPLTKLPAGYLTGPTNSTPCTVASTDFIPVATQTVLGTNLVVQNVGLYGLSEVSPSVFKVSIRIKFSNTIIERNPIETTVQFQIDSPNTPGIRPFKQCSGSIAATSSEPTELLFGGAYGDPSASPSYVNPATGAFSCPVGYSRVQVLGTPNFDYPMTICFRKLNDTSTAFPINYYAFGGFYGDSGGNNNPYTGAQSCPSGGYTPAQVMQHPGTDWSLYFCYKSLGSTPPDSTNSRKFGGFYSFGASAATNPLMGTSACPAGYSPARVFGAFGTDYDLIICWQ